mgnify:CR=1 FL=1
MTWQDIALKHAEKDAPHEACGLLAIYKGKEKYFPCKNLAEDLGEQFGEFLTQREVEYLRKNEFAMEADDIIWRRTKLGLKMSEQDVKRLSKYLKTS